MSSFFGLCYGNDVPGSLNPSVYQAIGLWWGGRPSRFSHIEGGKGGSKVTTNGRAVLTDIHSTSDSLRPAEALQGCCGGEGRGHLGTDRRQPGAQKVLGAGDCCLSSASCPQAAKYEDGVPANNGELAVRAKLVLPAGPGKLEEAQEGRWSPASGMFICHCVPVP